MNSYLNTANGFLIILGAGPQQEKLYKLAKASAHRIVGVDKNEDAVARDLCDIFICSSIKNERLIISKLEELQIQFCGVVTCGAEVSPQVSAIASHFGLKGIPHDVALATTDKAKRSKRLLLAGIPAPAYQECEKISEISIPFPLVIKPVDSSGSRGVVLVEKTETLSEAFLNAQAISSTNTVICEEYLSGGTEVSIEAFIINGNVHITGIAERHFLDISISAPHFVEYGGTMPPTFSDTLQNECKKTFENAIHALGITGGPSKGDLLIKDGKVYVLEVTTRTSPGFAAEMQPLNSGIEPLKILIKWATGNNVEPTDLEPKYNRGVAHRYYTHQEGTIKKITGLEALVENEDIKYYLMLDEPHIGKKLGPISYMNRLFYILTVGQTNGEAIKKAEKILKSIKIETVK